MSALACECLEAYCYIVYLQRTFSAYFAPHKASHEIKQVLNSFISGSCFLKINFACESMLSAPTPPVTSHAFLSLAASMRFKEVDACMQHFLFVAFFEKENVHKTNIKKEMGRRTPRTTVCSAGGASGTTAGPGRHRNTEAVAWRQCSGCLYSHFRFFLYELI